MKRVTLNSLLAAESSLLPDPTPPDGGPAFPFIRQQGSVFASELHAAERHYDRRLLNDDRRLLAGFLEARRVELGVPALPQTDSMFPGDTTMPTFPVPDVQPAPSPR